MKQWIWSSFPQKNIKVVGFKPRRIICLLGTKFQRLGSLSMSRRRVIPFEHVLFHVGFSVYQPCAPIGFHFILYSMWSRSKKVLQASGNSRWLSFRDCSYSRVVQVIQKHQGTHLLRIREVRLYLWAWNWKIFIHGIWDPRAWWTQATWTFISYIFDMKQGAWSSNGSDKITVCVKLCLLGVI